MEARATFKYAIDALDEKSCKVLENNLRKELKKAGFIWTGEGLDLETRERDITWIKELA